MRFKSPSLYEISRIWKSEKGIKRLKFQLGKKGSFNEEGILLGYSENIKELDADAQVNILVMNSSTVIAIL
ncbi:hypothetical protein D3Q75_16285 [Salmonella enterica]|nr:hypothetical protein [Salmonella enterica]ECE1692524.1 hypothetical protein [Salmonella enterica]